MDSRAPLVHAATQATRANDNTTPQADRRVINRSTDTGTSTKRMKNKNKYKHKNKNEDEDRKREKKKGKTKRLEALRRHVNNFNNTRDEYNNDPDDTVQFTGGSLVTIQSASRALTYALEAPKRDEFCIFWVDGSVYSPRQSASSLVSSSSSSPLPPVNDLPSSSSPISFDASFSPSSPNESSPPLPPQPTCPPSLTPQISAGASVVYEYPPQSSNWNCKGFCLTGIKVSEEAEILAIKAAVDLALEAAEAKAQYPFFREKIIIFSDCQTALRRISRLCKCQPQSSMQIAAGNSLDIVSKTAVAILESASHLQQLGVQLQLCWVKAHVKIPGNMVADAVAKNAMRYSGNLADCGSLSFEWGVFQAPPFGP